MAGRPPSKAREKAYRGLIANPEFVKEFYERVRAVKHPDACWVWQGYIDSAGFGRVRSGSRTFAAHRVAYELEHGPIGQGTIVKQTCNARCCVRVDHLQPINRKRTKGSKVKGSWAPYVNNLTSLTASIFDEDQVDLVGGVKVVFGDDPQVAVDKLSPLLRTLGDAVSRCVRLQGDILKAFGDANAKLAAIPGLTERHVELTAAVERVEESLSGEVSRETSRRQMPAITRETLSTTATTPHVSRPTTAEDGHVSRETSIHDGPHGPHVSRETSPPDDERLRIQRALAQLFSREIGPCDDAYAVYATYELALAHGGTRAGSLLERWMKRYAAAVEQGTQLPIAGRFLTWAVAEVSDGENRGGPDGPADSAPAPAASLSRPETPPRSSPGSGPTRDPADPPPDPPPPPAA